MINKESIIPLLGKTAIFASLAGIALQSRSGWNFGKKTKEEAWRIAKQNGTIPVDADWSDYDFHHRIPVAEAKRRGLARSIIRGIGNCIPMLRSSHKDAHRNQSLEEMADENMDIYNQQSLW